MGPNAGSVQGSIGYVEDMGMSSGPRMVRGFDVTRIEAAIRAAERRTSGEIRVALSRWYFWGDVRRAGERAFLRLGMQRTPERNGVLLFVVPWRRRFVILGDTGIHDQIGPDGWQRIADRLAPGLRAGDPSAALEAAIADIGERLALAFPSRGEAQPGRLPDDVALDP